MRTCFNFNFSFLYRLKLFLGRFEIPKKRNGNHFCAQKKSNRCAFCEIGFEDDEKDLEIKFAKSFELFEGMTY